MRIKSVNKIFHLDNRHLQVDIKATKELYQSQKRITDDCDCTDCRYFVNNFSKRPFEIFTFLDDCGVDICKNLNSEPDGIWCVRDDQGELLYCEQTFRLVGTMQNKNQYIYTKSELGYSVEALFSQQEETISIELTIEKPKNNDE